MLSALAEATERIELGTITLCASFRNPAIVAKMAVTVDEVSRGRFILGLGAGWNEPEYRAFGLPFDRRVDRFEEALQIIVPLLREGRVTFKGRYYSVEDCELAPRGPRRPGPPLLIGATGPRMVRIAARYADLWNEAEYLVRPEQFAAKRAMFEAVRSEPGARGAGVGVSTMLKVGWKDLGELPAFFGDDYVTGSSQEVAEVLDAWERSGVEHVICQYHPNTSATLERLIDALQTYRYVDQYALWRGLEVQATYAGFQPSASCKRISPVGVRRIARLSGRAWTQPCSKNAMHTAAPSPPLRCGRSRSNPGRPAPAVRLASPPHQNARIPHPLSVRVRRCPVRSRPCGAVPVACRMAAKRRSPPANGTDPRRHVRQDGRSRCVPHARSQQAEGYADNRHAGDDDAKIGGLTGFS